MKTFKEIFFIRQKDNINEISLSDKNQNIFVNKTKSSYKNLYEVFKFDNDL